MPTLAPSAIVAQTGLYGALSAIQDDPGSPDVSWMTAEEQFTGTPWYVRPAGSTYGSANGTSYADAWAGFAAIQWASIQPGDTLYMLGRFHGGTYLNRGWNTCTAAGITIKGQHVSYPADSGVIVPAFLKVAGASFGSPGGTYAGAYEASTSIGYYVIEHDSSDDQYRLMTSVADPVNLVAGSCYFDGAGDIIYWIPYAGTVGDKTLMVLGPNTECIIGASNVVVTGLRFIGATESIYKPALGINSSGSYARVIDNSFEWCRGAVGFSSFNMTNCPSSVEIADNTCTDGCVFLMCDTNQTFTGWSVLRNQCIDMDDPRMLGSQDNEVFYIQGMQNSAVSFNVVDGYANGAIDFYAVSNTPALGGAAPIINNVIEGNIIRNGTYQSGVDDQMTGIFFSCDNSNWDNNSADPFVNNVVRNNLIHDLDGTGATGYFAAIRLKGRRPAYSGDYAFKVYNNTVANLSANMYAVQNTGFVENGTPDLYLVNNIFANVGKGFSSITGDQSDWVTDHNCWYGVDTAASFMVDATSYTYANWVTALDTAGATGISGAAESHSVTSDPLFTGAEVFTLQAGSPCVNAGADTGITSDLAGNSRPVGAMDIGAYERQ